MKSQEFLGKLTNDNVARTEIGACGTFSFADFVKKQSKSGSHKTQVEPK